MEKQPKLLKGCDEQTIEFEAERRRNRMSLRTIKPGRGRLL
jgi:hypothetical protein